MSLSPERPSLGGQKRNVQTGEKPPLGHKEPIMNPVKGVPI